MYKNLLWLDLEKKMINYFDTIQFTVISINNSVILLKKHYHNITLKLVAEVSKILRAVYLFL